MPEEPSAKSLDYAQKYKDVFLAFTRLGFTRAEAIQILSRESWHYTLFEDKETI